jgi:hypothetical protein
VQCLAWTFSYAQVAVTLLPPKAASRGVESGTLESGLDVVKSSPAGRYTLFLTLCVLLTLVV